MHDYKSNCSKHNIDSSYMPCKMFYISREVVFISVWFLFSEAVFFQNNFGMKTDTPPKDSCQKIFNVQNKGKCMMSCLAALDVHYMFSYNEGQETCLCCKDLTGSDVISPGWETFVPRKFIFFIISDIRKFLQIIFFQTIDAFILINQHK